jgi:hypothetical protein
MGPNRLLRVKRQVLKQPFLRFLLCAVLVFSGCSGQPPELAQIFWQLNVVQNTEDSSQYEELSLFLHAEDPDGLEDIDRIELLHAPQELLWSFSPSEWRVVEREGATWIGTVGIRSASTRTIPRGEYRVRLSDKAGESVETKFIMSGDITGLQRGELAGRRFPQAQVTPQAVQLSSDSGELLVSLYDSEGGFIRSELVETAADGSVSINNWPARWSGAHSIRLQQYDAARGFGLVSGPHKLPAEQ